MSMVRWDPFRELEEMSHRLNRVFAGPAQLTRSAASEAMAMPEWAPAVDVAETAEEFLIKVELPGLKKEDVQVAVEHGVLSIRGERKQEKEEKNKKYHRVERLYGSFMRTFRLPDNVDETKVHAEFKDGVLSVRLAKTAKAMPKAIDIKVT